MQRSPLRTTARCGIAFGSALLLGAPAASAQSSDNDHDDAPTDWGVPGYSRDPDSPDFSAYSPFYTGSFTALGAYAGPTLVSGEGLEDGQGVAYGGWVQATSPMQVLDVRLAYTGSAVDTTLRDGRPVRLRQDALTLIGGGHPLFLAHLENSWLFYTLAGFYILFGLDAEYVQAEVAGEEEAGELDLGIRMGLGIDMALDDVDDGGALWLGFQYVYNQWDFDDAPVRDLSIGQHLLFVQLGYRRNGLLFTLPPSRPEPDDADTDAL